MSKRFHLGDVLSITTGRLLAPDGMAGVHAILDYMTGDTLFTHQLPRALRECAPELLRQHPWLADIVEPAEFTGRAQVEEWLAARVVQHGEHVDVTPLARGDHTYIDPLQELAMNRPHLQVIPVVLEGEEA